MVFQRNAPISLLDLFLSGSLPEGALRKLHLHLCYHLKEVAFYLYNMRLEEYVAIK